MLDQLADAYQEVWQERVDLRDRIEQLEAEVTRYREGENLLRRTMVSAEKSAADQKEAARQEAQRIVREAEQEAREVVGEAHLARAAVWREVQELDQRSREVKIRFRSFLARAESVLIEIAEEEEHTDERRPLAVHVSQPFVEQIRQPLIEQIIEPSLEPLGEAFGEHTAEQAREHTADPFAGLEGEPPEHTEERTPEPKAEKFTLYTPGEAGLSADAADDDRVGESTVDCAKIN